MTTTAKATLTVTGWDEETYDDLGEGRKLTRASVTQSVTGDIEGDCAASWVSCYTAADRADIVGLSKITGRLGERSGSFVLRTHATFDGSVAEGTWTVVPGSGTDGLAGLRGEGGFRAPTGPDADGHLEYDIENADA